MMPGAVQLVDGSLEMVAGCQARSAEDPAPAVTELPHPLSTIVTQPEPPLRACWRVVSACPPASVLFRASLEPRGTPAASSDDD